MWYYFVSWRKNVHVQVFLQCFKISLDQIYKYLNVYSNDMVYLVIFGCCKQIYSSCDLQYC